MRVRRQNGRNNERRKSLGFHRVGCHFKPLVSLGQLFQGFTVDGVADQESESLHPGELFGDRREAGEEEAKCAASEEPKIKLMWLASFRGDCP
jgi:hypothetical protein